MRKRIGELKHTVKWRWSVILVSSIGCGTAAAGAEPDQCLECHKQVNPGIVADWSLSKHALPDLLTLHDAPTPIAQRLFEMHLEHRMRAFQGTFHANPDYALWYGWSEMRRDLTEIKEMAAGLRARRGDAG